MENLETATFAGGCFWCLEAIFKRIKGVEKVESGFAGGTDEEPEYSKESLEKTGHAEVVQLIFNPEQISYRDLVYVFFKMHDPTTLNRQGNDVGTQYRSEILYHNLLQKKVASDLINELEENGYYKYPIVTEVSPFKKFFKAEDYHQNFYDENPQYPYCQVVIDPKIKKLISNFENKLKSDL